MDNSSKKTRASLRWTAFWLLFTPFLCLQAADLPAGFAELLVAQELDPTAMALTPDGRLLLLEKNGRVLVVENGQLLPDPLLVLEVDNYNERGLSGIAIDPDFAQNGHFYLYYTAPGVNHNRVSRFTAEGNYAQAGSETVLLELDPLSGTIHNGGSMAFGTDGKLYVSVGDGADAGNAQNLNSLLGKVLRLEPNGAIPTDNPFYNQNTGKYRAIWALGFRNPFSLAIQPGSGRVFVSEVGNGAWEEVNEVISGKNYGWPIIEGPLAGQTPPDNYQEPVFAYDHAQGCAAVGAAFYNPSSLLFPAAYQGKFFFADYCSGYIKYLDPNVPGVATTFATGINRPLNMLVAPDGSMYYLARAGLGGGSEVDNTATSDGTLWRIFYNGSGAPFVSVNPQPVLIPEGESATFVTAASGDEPLQYQWQRDGLDIAGAESPAFIFPDAMLSDSGAVFRCIVSNADGADTTLGAELRVTASRRPEPEILLPVPGTTYRAGDALLFEGRAGDHEEGELPATALRWKIDFHHDLHTHPGLSPTTGIASGAYDIPQTGETASNVWYQIHLTATDQSGLSKTVTRDVFPEKTQFHVYSEPSPLPVYVDGDFGQTPLSVTSVIGIFRRVEALRSVVAGDSIYFFTNWLDGETSPVREFEAPEDTLTFTALYEKYPLGQGTGLRAFYYDGPMYDPTFYEPYAFTWIDTTVNFDWGGGSPAFNQLGDDFWLVRWEGFVETLLEDTYRFHVISDDGLRLWVDDQLIIDQWIPQAPTETSGTINLQENTKYPIRLEYFEEGGGAVCRLLWSSDRIDKSIIPRSQLYPELANAVQEIGKVPLRVYPNPATDGVVVETEQGFPPGAELEVLNPLGQVMLRSQDAFSTGHSRQWLNLYGLPAGAYWIRINFGEAGIGLAKIIKLGTH